MECDKPWKSWICDRIKWNQWLVIKFPILRYNQKCIILFGVNIWKYWGTGHLTLRTLTFHRWQNCLNSNRTMNRCNIYWLCIDFWTPYGEEEVFARKRISKSHQTTLYSALFHIAHVRKKQDIFWEGANGSLPWDHHRILISHTISTIRDMYHFDQDLHIYSIPYTYLNPYVINWYDNTWQ